MEQISRWMKDKQQIYNFLAPTPSPSPSTSQSPSSQEMKAGHFLNYVRHLSLEKDNNLFILPWRSCIIRNCTETGTLLKPELLETYKPLATSMWVQLTASLFRDMDGSTFGLLVCSKCSSMQGVQDLGANQEKEALLVKRCHHSKAFEMLLPEWKVSMELPENFEGEKIDLFKNKEIKTQMLKSGSSDGLFLGVYQNENKL